MGTVNVYSAEKVNELLAGKVGSINGQSPDAEGNIDFESGSVTAAIDPADTSGLTLLLRVPSIPSASLTLTKDGYQVTASWTAISPDGLLLTFDIDWGDGTVQTGVSSGIKHTYAAGAATWSVKITVTDSEGTSSTSIKTISVSPPDASALGAQILIDGAIVYYPMSDAALPPVDYQGKSVAVNIAPSAGGSPVVPDIDASNIGDGVRCLKFKGSGYSIGQPAQLDLLGEWTIEILYQQTITNAQGYLWRRTWVNGSNLEGIEINWGNSGLSVVKNRSGSEKLDILVPTSQSDINHLMVTYDGTTLIGYVDGVKISEKALSGWVLPGAGTGPWVFGDNCYGRLAGGAIYNKALTAARAAAHASAAGRM